MDKLLLHPFRGHGEDLIRDHIGARPWSHAAYGDSAALAKAVAL
jgi:hypothetical protein